jgi:hypothetical protein
MVCNFDVVRQIGSPAASGTDARLMAVQLKLNPLIYTVEKQVNENISEINVLMNFWSEYK